MTNNRNFSKTDYSSEKSKRKNIQFRVYFRKERNNKKKYAIRFIYEGKVFLTRITDASTAARAGAIAARIIATEDLLSIAEAKMEKKACDLTEIDQLASLPVVEFLRKFWNPEQSPYLQDMAAAGKPLSGSYIRDNAANIDRYWTVDPLRTLPMRELRLKHIDSRVRTLRKMGKSRYTIAAAIDCIRTPCSWLCSRGVMDKIDFSAIVLPKAPAKERGILSTEELGRILNLPAVGPWQDANQNIHISVRPRRRLPGAQKNEGIPPVGWREKLIIVLLAFTGARVGEARALKWKHVDFEKGLIRIELNYTDADGLKEPKAKSRRSVPISDTLVPYLIEARKIAQETGTADPEHFVLMNAMNPDKPVAMTTVKRAWERVLRAIGVTAEEQKKRNLVIHGLRHLYATRLVDAGLTPIEAAKLTGHRVMATLVRYSDHTQEETLEKSRQILDRLAMQPFMHGAALLPSSDEKP
jgi:integrase